MPYVEVELDTFPEQDPGPVRRAILLSRNNLLYCYESVLDGTVGDVSVRVSGRVAVAPSDGVVIETVEGPEDIASCVREVFAQYVSVQSAEPYALELVLHFHPCGGASRGTELFHR